MEFCGLEKGNSEKYTDNCAVMETCIYGYVVNRLNYTGNICVGMMRRIGAVFELTERGFLLSPSFSDKLYAMLSMAFLPMIYSNVLDMDGTWIFKIVYPLIFAFVLVGLYQLFKSKVNKEIALFCVFFISNLVFFTELVVLASERLIC